MNNEVNQPAAKAEPRKLETQFCPRCGGSGEYSYCQSYGTRCFKCAGNKIIYTKRGLMAFNYLQDLRSVNVQQIVVGQSVRVEHLLMPAMAMAKVWAKVTESYAELDEAKWATSNGVKIPHWVMVTEHPKYGVMHSSLPMDAKVRISFEGEAKVATFQQALDYQDSLSPSGKPYKNGRKSTDKPVQSPEARRAAKVAREAKLMLSGDALLANEAVREHLKSQPHPYGRAEMLLGYYEYCFKNAGKTRRLQLAKELALIAQKLGVEV